MRRALLRTFAFVGIFATTLSPAFAQCAAEYYCPNGFVFSCIGTNSCSVNAPSQTITCDETTPSGYPGGVKVGNLTTYYCSYCVSLNECDSAGW